MAGKPWYNNGIDEKQYGPNDEIPVGFVRGRKPRSDIEKQKAKLKLQQTLANKSEEEKAEVNRRRGQTWLNTYNNKSKEEKEQLINQRVTTMANKSDAEKQAYSDKLSKSLKGKNLGKTPWNKGLTKESDERVLKSAQKLSVTNKEIYNNLKETDPDYFIQWRKAINNTMRLNNSFNSSKPEDEYYQKLLEIYGKDDVIRNYYDERYPFQCDFYIPSQDLFIELNKTWTHGGHPFDSSNLNDISKLEDWEEKAEFSNYYKNAIYTWTDLDVRKQKIAKENHLNYKAIY